MVTSPNGDGVVLLGGYNSKAYKYSKAIIELKGTTLKWVTLNQTLRYPRKWHVALPIPDELTTCSEL